MDRILALAWYHTGARVAFFIHPKSKLIKRNFFFFFLLQIHTDEVLRTAGGDAPYPLAVAHKEHGVTLQRDILAWKNPPVNPNNSSATLHFGKASAAPSFPEVVLHRQLNTLFQPVSVVHPQRGKIHPQQSPDRHRRPPSLFVMIYLRCL